MLKRVLLLENQKINFSRRPLLVVPGPRIHCCGFSAVTGYALEGFSILTKHEQELPCNRHV